MNYTLRYEYKIIMKTITSSELRKNLIKYLHLANTEDILVISRDRTISLLTKPKFDKYDQFLSCCGLLEDCNKNYEKLLEERDLNR